MSPCFFFPHARKHVFVRQSCQFLGVILRGRTVLQHDIVSSAATAPWLGDSSRQAERRQGQEDTPLSWFSSQVITYPAGGWELWSFQQRSPKCQEARNGTEGAHLHAHLTTLWPHTHTHTESAAQWHTLSFVETSPAVTVLTDSYDGLDAMQRVWLAQVKITSWEVNQIQFRQEIYKLLHVLHCQMYTLRYTVSYAVIWFHF